MDEKKYVFYILHHKDEENKEDNIVVEEKPVEHTTSKEVPSYLKFDKLDDFEFYLDGDNVDKSEGYYLIENQGLLYKYTLYSPKNEILAVSVLYDHLIDAMRHIYKVRDLSLDAKVGVEVNNALMYQFKLLAKNNKPILYSSSFKSDEGVKEATTTFLNIVFKAPIIVKEAYAKENEDNIVDYKKYTKGGAHFDVVVRENNYIYILYNKEGAEVLRSKYYPTDIACVKGISNLKTELNSGYFIIEKSKNSYHLKLISLRGLVIYESEGIQKEEAKSLAEIIYSNAQTKRINLPEFKMEKTII